MELVLTALTLNAPGGMQSYLLTVAPQLERLGHEVTLYAPEQGTMADVARSRGLRVAGGEHELPDICDAVIAQDGITMLDMADRYPDSVRAIVVHSAEYDIHLPPGPEGTVSCAIVMNDAVERRVRAMANPPRVERLRQPLDTDRHRPVGTAPDRPRRVLMLGNYLSDRGRDALVRVCEDSGLEWRQVGSHGELLSDPLAAINQADIVIGQGRSALDAMASARATWVYGPIAGDGWVTPDTYPAFEADGFRGRATDHILNAESFGRALEEFDPAMGADNRKLITLHHSAYEHVIGLVGLLDTTTVGHKVDAPLRELARVVRTQYEAQSGMEGMANQLRAALEAQDGTRSALAAANEQLAALGLENERLRQEVLSMTGSRRWAALSLLLSPVDSARRRRQP